LTDAKSVPVLHVAEDMAASSGGVPAVVRQLASRWAGSGGAVTVLHAKGDASDMPTTVRVVRQPPQGIGRLWSYSSGLHTSMTQLMSDAARDGAVVHIHGLWAAPPTLAAQSAVAQRVPSLFTAHGMLVPWLWNNQGHLVKLKKSLFWRFIAEQSLRRCTMVHAITPMERDELRLLLPKSVIEVIPNAIELSPSACFEGGQDKVVLFLGRIEPKKGVDVLIRAFARARLAGSWRLDIVGPSWSADYMTKLKSLARENGIDKRVRFLGAIFGDEKALLLGRAWVLAAPSHSEVVGLVNLEAGSHCLPSITTHQTGLSDWAEGGGLLVQPDEHELAEALRSAAAWSDTERTQRGLASRTLVEQRYSWAAVMPMWRDLYKTISQKG